ncbi:MAG: hypothetical protein ACRET0_00355 [Steroidobacteraceae bacterium]
MISTIEERGRARQQLEQRSSEALAAFILTLLHAPQGVGACVEAFIAADEPERSVGLIEAQISALRRGETDYEWRHRRGEDFTARAELVLDAIEHVVLPRDAAGALRLLERFYDSEREIADGSFGDDFGLSCVFERAARLFQAAGGALPAAEVDALRERLLAHDDYGFRRHLRARDQ